VIDVKLAPIQESEYVYPPPFLRARVPIYEVWSRITQLVYDMMNTPDDFYRHLRRVTASIACTFIYGQRGATYESFWGHVSLTITNKGESPKELDQANDNISVSTRH
jgi:hypothetical protein